MPIANNRYYNDPAIGAAFGNLASAFAPPSGAELSGYATAKAKKEEAERLAQLFQQAQSPDFNQSMFDRMGQAAGQWTPNSGYYGVDSQAATMRRGQDVTANTALEQARLEADAALARQMAEPIITGENQIAHLPTQTQSATGLDGALSGPSVLSQGETMMRPDGSTLQGADKPLTESEMRALILGDLSEDEQRASALHDVPVEAIVMEDGSTQNVYRHNSIGERPAPSGATETQNYRGPDGSLGTARFDGQHWRDTATGESIPENSITFNTSLEGGGAETGIGPTTSNMTDGNNLNAAVANGRGISQQLRQLVTSNPAASGAAGNAMSLGQDVAQVAKEFSQVFGENPDASVSANQLQQFIEQTLPGDQANYNPVYHQIRSLLLELAYANAQMNNPSGEVSRFALQRELEALGQGMFGSDQSLLAVLDTFDMRMDRKEKQANILRGVGPTDTASPAGTTDTNGVRTIDTPAGSVTIQRVN